MFTRRHWMFRVRGQPAVTTAVRSCGSRRATTLIELLVVIAIIGILVGITVPAVQMARESARQCQCANNLRQTATGIIGHESIRQSFPHGGWSGANAPAYQNGRARAGREQLAGWAFQILPQLDEELLHRRPAEVAIATPVEIYFCPSRGGARVLPALPTTPSLYGSDPNQGMYPLAQPIAHAAIDYASAYVDPHCLDPATEGYAEFCNPMQEGEDSGCIIRLKITTHCDPPRPLVSLIGRTDVRDGCGHTLLVAEKRMNAACLGEYQLDDDQGYSAGWDFDSNRNASLPPERDYYEPLATLANPQTAAAEFRRLSQFGSAHSRGLNAAFADGSVKFLSYSIEPLVFHRMGGRNDGRTLAE